MMITRTWRVAAMATLGMLCTGALQAQSQPEWTYLGGALPDVTAMAISPVDPDFMLARLDSGSGLPVAKTVWLSMDGGARWRPLPDAGMWVGGQMGFTSEGRALVPDDGVVHVTLPEGPWWIPLVPQGAPYLVYADVSVGAGDVVYLSTLPYGGSTDDWRVTVLDLDTEQLHPRSPPLPAGHQFISLLAADATQSGVVMALSDTSPNPWPTDPRLWSSTDGGLSWTEQTHAMPTQHLAGVVFTDAGALAAFASDGSSGMPGVYRSVDHGQNWELLSVGAPGFAFATGIAVDPADPQRLLVSTWDGLHLSEDGGLSWQLGVVGPEWRLLSGVTFAPDGGAFVSGFEGGLFRADADLQSMTPVDGQLGAMAATSVAVNPADPADVAATARTYFAAVATSADGGLSWDPEWTTGVGGARQVAFGPDARLYVAGRTHNRSLLVRGADGEWDGLMPHIGTLSDLHSLAFGASAQHLLVSARINTGNGSENQIRVSTDGGGNWTVAHVLPSPSRDVSQLLNASGPAGGRYLALMADTVLSDPVLLLGTDGGQTWGPAGAGLPAGLRQARVCTNGAAAPRAYLSALDGNQPRLFRSDDDGLSWHTTAWVPPMSGHQGRIGALWCDPERPEVVVVGRADGSVLRSTDAGASFVVLGNDLAGETHEVTAFSASPAGLLYAATSEGVWAVALPDDAPAAPTNLVVTATGAHARPLMTLGWDGGQEQVMVRRNGALLAVVANTGSFQDRPAPREMPASYQVCNADGSHCTGAAAARR